MQHRFRLDAADIQATGTETAALFHHIWPRSSNLEIGVFEADTTATEKASLAAGGGECAIVLFFGGRDRHSLDQAGCGTRDFPGGTNSRRAADT
jgi:hypothetical protein